MHFYRENGAKEKVRKSSFQNLCNNAKKYVRSGSTVVEHQPHHPEVVGSSPAAGIGREKGGKKLINLWLRTNVIKIFTTVIYECCDQPFLLGLMFASNAGAYPSEAPFRSTSLWKAPSLASKQTKLDKLARDKQPSLLPYLMSIMHIQV
jgi:hypothetical protein